jgi:hypothetical protein
MTDPAFDLAAPLFELARHKHWPSISSKTRMGIAQPLPATGPVEKTAAEIQFTDEWALIYLAELDMLIIAPHRPSNH